MSVRDEWREIRADGNGRLASVRWLVGGSVAVWWDGHPLHERLWDLRHPPSLIYWHPDVSLKLRRWNPLFWLVVLLGEK